jgi:uncharacterized protein involved in tolerance to divalent cations
VECTQSTAAVVLEAAAAAAAAAVSGIACTYHWQGTLIFSSIVRLSLF